MTEHQIQLIQRSFLTLLPQVFDAGAAFYARLFEIAPQVKPLFGEDMSQQSKKLMRMLGMIVDGLYNFEEITQQIIELGERSKATKLNENTTHSQKKRCLLCCAIAWVQNTTKRLKSHGKLH